MVFRVDNLYTFLFNNVVLFNLARSKDLILKVKTSLEESRWLFKNDRWLLIDDDTVILFIHYRRFLYIFHWQINLTRVLSFKFLRGTLKFGWRYRRFKTHNWVLRGAYGVLIDYRFFITHRIINLLSNNFLTIEIRKLARQTFLFFYISTFFLPQNKSSLLDMGPFCISHRQQNIWLCWLLNLILINLLEW